MPWSLQNARNDGHEWSVKYPIKKWCIMSSYSLCSALLFRPRFCFFFGGSPSDSHAPFALTHRSDSGGVIAAGRTAVSAGATKEGALEKKLM